MNKKKHPIVFIHGMWSTPEIWRVFSRFYEQQGYTVHAPALRHHEETDQNQMELARTSIDDYLEDLTAFIETLSEKPILIGHSLGALLALQLASRGLAAQAVLISPVAPAGFFGLYPSVIRTLAGTFSQWGFWRKSIKLSEQSAACGILGCLPDEEQTHHYQSMVHESGRAIFQAFFWLFDRSRASRVRKVPDCPVLVMVGRQDRLTPPNHTRNVARDFGADWMVLEEHGHWLPLEAGSERVAEQSEIWLTLHEQPL